MNVGDHVNTYQVFIDVLSFRYVTTHQVALTGQMIAASAELSHMLGRTKMHADKHAWYQVSDQFRRAMEVYRTAWANSAPESVGDPEAPPYPGIGVTPAFESAVAMMQAAVEEMRRELASMGMASWRWE
jgi:hypothetical protein